MNDVVTGQGMNTRIQEWVRPEVRAQRAYHVPDAEGMIKLDAMENPFPLPPVVRREIAAVVKNAQINLYPDPSAKILKKAIASFWKMNPGQMILGNGSDELIQAVILAFGGPVLVPVPTFAMYDITSRALAQKVVTVPLDDSLDLDAGRMMSSTLGGLTKLDHAVNTALMLGYVAIAKGDEVWVYYYKDNLPEKIAARPDIFRKVR